MGQRIEKRIIIPAGMTAFSVWLDLCITARAGAWERAKIADHLVAVLMAIITATCPMDVIAGESVGTNSSPPVTSSTLKGLQNSKLPSQLPQVQPILDGKANSNGFASGELMDTILPTPERDSAACIDQHNDLAPAMVVLPPGHFRMGTPKNEPSRYDDEGPQHWVTLRKPFAMGRCEVTVGQFRRFVEETGYVTEAEKPDAKGCNVWNSALKKYEQRKGSHWRQPEFPQTDHHPVVCVTHADALAYVHWLSRRTGAHYRLPTEAEWEYAVRATPAIDRHRTTARYWGDDSEGKQQCDYANGADQTAKSELGADWTYASCTDHYAYTAPVASFRPTLLGLYDMLGNAWEWTADCWHKDYTGAPADGSAWLEASQGDCKLRVVRGGSWGGYPQSLRSGGRGRGDEADYYLGFRLARDF